MECHWRLAARYRYVSFTQIDFSSLFVDLGPIQFAWASSAAAVLERFGDFSARDILGDDNLNSPLNAFTTEGLAHMLFDRLDLWLTPAQVRRTA